MALYHGYVSLQNRGTFAWPAEVRRRLRLDSPGVQLEITERDDGVFEVRPVVPVPADQAWFWSTEWQAGEREASQDIEAGRVTRVDDDGLLTAIRDAG